MLWLLIKTSRVKGLSAIILGFVSGACSAGLIALINRAIVEESSQSLVLPFVVFVVAALISNYLTQVLLIDLSQDAVYRLRLQLSQRILSAPLQRLEQLGASRLLAVLTEDIQAISSTVYIIPNLCISIAVIVGCLTYLGALNGWALAVVALFLAVAMLIVQLLMNLAYRYLARARKEVDQLYKQFRGVTEGTKELKLNAIRRAAFLDEDLRQSAVRTRDHTKTAFKMGAIASSSGQLLFFVLIGLLLFVADRIVPNIGPVLPAYVLTITYLLGPLEKIISDTPIAANAGVSIRKVEQMGLSLGAVFEPSASTQSVGSQSSFERSPSGQTVEIGTAIKQLPTERWQTLQLMDVIHRYQQAPVDVERGDPTSEENERSAFSVGPINLTIHSGELVFIVGGNGSGKSTLAKIVAGLYAPVQGKLKLNQTPVVDSNREEYRQLFSAVFSDFYLFERLIDEGAIALESNVQTYLTKLQLENKVFVENGHLSTTALSQGQRKRLALLAAYLEDRPIYLFDEWAADQDPIFREIFYTQLLPELKQQGKTVLVISHDDHYFHMADRIIKMDYGQVVSQ